jgi:hypothetical protein
MPGSALARSITFSHGGRSKRRADIALAYVGDDAAPLGEIVATPCPWTCG